MTKIQTRMTIFAPLAALALWDCGLEAQAVGERVRASLADQTMVGEVTAVSEHGFQLGHEDGVDSILFGDLVRLERSVGQKRAWIEGYVIGAAILVYPGIQLIRTCMEDPTMGENAFLTTFCLIFLFAPGVVLVAAGVLITGPIGAIIGAFNHTDVWEQVTVPESQLFPALRIPPVQPVQAFARQRLEIGFRIAIPIW